MTASWRASPPLLAILPAIVWRRTSRARQRAAFTVRRLPARLRAPDPLQHVLHRARGDRKLLRVAGAQDHVGIGPVLRIEEWIAADRHFGIGLGNLAELGADVALARVRAQRLRQDANAGLELGGDLVEHRLHDGRYAGHDDDVADPNSGRARHLVE